MYDHITIRSIKTKHRAHWLPYQVRFYQFGFNESTSSKTNQYKMHVKELSLALSFLTCHRLEYLTFKNRSTQRRHIAFMKLTTFMSSRLHTFSSFTVFSQQFKTNLFSTLTWNKLETVVSYKRQKQNKSANESNSTQIYSMSQESARYHLSFSLSKVGCMISQFYNFFKAKSV